MTDHDDNDGAMHRNANQRDLDNSGDSKLQGYRKDGTPYQQGNTRADGSYAVGKNRAPAGGQFAKGDGRTRGRRRKGVQNADTEFERELNKQIEIKENGRPRQVTKGHAVDLKLIQNAAVLGQIRAIEFVDERRERIRVRKEAAAQYQSTSDYEILAAFLRERAAELDIDPAVLGDPDEERQSGDD